MEPEKIVLGLIINPIAGLGGPLALKGSDVADIRLRAAKNGVSPRAGVRTETALESLIPLSDKLHFLTASGAMGEQLLAQMGFSYEVVWHTKAKTTTAEDTILAVKAMAKRSPQLIAFSGGDGTARNIAQAVGVTIPVVGIPAGVKIHSAVYAASPADAGQLLAKVARGTPLVGSEREVMDIDEEAFRNGQVVSRLYGYLKVPRDKHLLQNRKMGGLVSEAATLRGIARRVVQEMLPGVVYLMGGGTTVAAVMKELGLPYTLLGVDMVLDKTLLKADATSADIEKAADEHPCKAVLSVIGGQGFILGRGNQQLRPSVLSRMCKEDLIVAATKEKLISIMGNPMRLDTGDREQDKRLSGYYRVIVGYDETVVYEAK